MARPKGVPNHISGETRENVRGVFIALGGRKAMTEWATKNQSEFYRLYAKLLPTAVEGDLKVDVSDRLERALKRVGLG